MNTISKNHGRPDELSDEALFRWQLVSRVLTETRLGRSRSEVVSATVANPHIDFREKARSVGERTLHRWFAAYLEKGIPGLEPDTREARIGESLPKGLLDFAAGQKSKDPRASLPEILRRAREKGVLGEDVKVHRSSLRRGLRHRGVLVHRRRRAQDRDSRRFAYSHRLQMVLCDGKHFRAGAGRLRRVALFFLDDATRKVLTVVVGTSENAALFLRGLQRVLLDWGRMEAFYTDRGAGFKARDTAAVFTKLEIPHIMGEAAYPEGHGKIERFNRTALQDLLRHLDRDPTVDPDCPALELLLQHYIDEGYNLRPHESLDQATPFDCFRDDSKALELYAGEDCEWVRSCFVLSARRRVSPDHIVKVGDVHYETPKGYAGAHVVLRRHLLEQKVFLLHQGALIELHPVDLAQNARSKRSRGGSETEAGGVLPPSSAQLAFRRAFGSVVDPQGGYVGTGAVAGEGKGSAGDDPEQDSGPGDKPATGGDAP